MYAIAAFLLFAFAAVAAATSISVMIKAYGGKALDALRFQHVPRATLEQLPESYVRVRPARAIIAERATISPARISHAA